MVHCTVYIDGDSSLAAKCYIGIELHLDHCASKLAIRDQNYALGHCRNGVDVGEKKQ